MADNHTLFHYTSNEVLWSIVKHKTFRLTSLTQSNDSLEGKWIWRVMEWPGFGTYLRRCKAITPTGIRNIRRQLETASNAVGLCLSAERDLLSQWRGYADGGHGVSIGFDRDVLLDLADKSEQDVKLRKVSYDLKEQRDQLYGLFGALDHLANTVFPEPPNDKFWEHEFVFRPEFADVLLEFTDAVYNMKNPAFREEREFRLVNVYHGPMVNPPYDFQPSRHQIKPFLPISFDGTEEVICSVTLGPKNETPEEVMKAMLKSIGCDVPVKRSTASYR